MHAVTITWFRPDTHSPTSTHRKFSPNWYLLTSLNNMQLVGKDPGLHAHDHITTESIQENHQEAEGRTAAAANNILCDCRPWIQSH